MTTTRRGIVALMVLGAATAVGAAPRQEAARRAADRLRETANAARAAVGAEIAAPVGSGPAVLFVDADNDGMDDAWEAAFGLNPADPGDAWLDGDGDQTANLFEFQLGANPTQSGSPPVATVAATGADYSDLGAAIDGVAPGTVLRIAGGAHAVAYQTFQPRVVMLQGGWAPGFAYRDPWRHPTRLVGNGADEVLYFSVAAGEWAVALQGLRISGGGGSFGAVALIAQGTSRLRSSVVDCVISGSTSSTSYGGVLAPRSWDSSETDWTVANTQVAGNAASGVYAAVTGQSLARWRLVNVTIAGQAAGGADNGYGLRAFTLDTASLVATLVNGIVWGNATPDVMLGRAITLSASYSDVGTVQTYSGAVYLPGAGMLSIPPGFVDAAAGDYHLAPTSPCVDQGTSAGAPPRDLEGDSRPSGAGIDIGADEHGDRLFVDGFDSGP
jgi:hypothetical protein